MRRVLPCGERALLVELDGLDDVLALDAAIRAAPLAGIDDVVPAARTVLIHFDPAVVPAVAIVAHVDLLLPPDRRTTAGTGGQSAARQRPEIPRPAEPAVEIPVRYDGDDLPHVAVQLGLTVGELVALHSSCSYRVALVGFAPGFAYMVGEDAELDVPRRTTPRTAVPAGAVALAGGYCGIYPREMPGGWQLIGCTTATVWDERRDPPALLRPGASVRFVIEWQP